MASETRRDYDAIDIAKYIITYRGDRGKPVTNRHLQFLLYYAWIDYYHTRDEALFLEDFSAWPLGPVVSEVYYKFGAFGGARITWRYDVSLPLEVADSVAKTVDSLMGMSMARLSEIARDISGAWYLTFQGGDGARKVIRESFIKFFEPNHAMINNTTPQKKDTTTPPPPVPYIAYESAVARGERIAKRLVVALIASNVAWAAAFVITRL